MRSSAEFPTFNSIYVEAFQKVIKAVSSTVKWMMVRMLKIAETLASICFEPSAAVLVPRYINTRTPVE
ncbi:hypothetical protein [Calothrix sp. CCY 0018]|uniref:hypothetical protein n=1 Tax=Calothrix sp. CCY 0018 TaxID=3103864 RepID=UPI0039C74E54